MKDGGTVVAMVVVTAAMLFYMRPASGQQTPAYRAPRFAGTQNPDLNGIWEALNSANWDLEPHTAAPSPFPAILGEYGAQPAGQGVVEGGKIPISRGRRTRRRRISGTG